MTSFFFFFPPCKQYFKCWSVIRGLGAHLVLQRGFRVNPHLVPDARRMTKLFKMKWEIATRHPRVLQHRSCHEKPQQTPGECSTMVVVWQLLQGLASATKAHPAQGQHSPVCWGPTSSWDCSCCLPRHEQWVLRLR